MAKTFIIKPGLQNPHCSAPSCARKLPNSSASLCIPSIVTIFFPSARTARTEQESTGFSSISTVQRPQFAVSHPLLTLAQPFSLKKSRSITPGSTSSWRYTPFNQKLIFICHSSYCFPCSFCQHLSKKRSVFCRSTHI